MKHAPPIVGALEFAGLSNNIILVEHDDDDSLDLLGKVLTKKVNIIFSPSDHRPNFDGTFTALCVTDSISRIHRLVKACTAEIDHIVIDRIDLMDSGFTKKERGAQHKAFLSMMASERILRGANLIVTSCRSEYSIRDIANRYLSLRK